MNSTFDEKYDIRQARYDEIDEIMQFINTYWKNGHILATNREFFEYEFVVGGNVNFFLAKNRETAEIESLTGCVFASNNPDKRDIWGSIWKTRNDHPNMPFLGMELGRRLDAFYKVRNHLGVGINPGTAMILLQAVDVYCAKMNHFYRISDKEEYKIAKISNKIIVSKNDILQFQPKLLNSLTDLEKEFDFELVKDCVPYKDPWYVNRRYFTYPIYKYNVYSIPNAIFVTREQEFNGEKILRIVDYIGERSSFGGLYDFFTERLKEYEYIDFYNLGFEEEFLLNAGFVKREETSENIIPNYFSPFVQKNVEIYVHAPNQNCLFFKADADQDRPN